MLGTPDYLRVKKRRTDCSACGCSLVEAERIPSILLDPKDTDMPVEPETVSAETPQPEPSEGTPEPGDSPGAETPVAPKRDPRGKTEAKTSEKDSAPAEETEEESFLRRDYCEACWQELKDRAFFARPGNFLDIDFIAQGFQSVFLPIFLLAVR